MHIRAKHLSGEITNPDLRVLLKTLEYQYVCVALYAENFKPNMSIFTESCQTPPLITYAC